jgi:hypothetical protein
MGMNWLAKLGCLAAFATFFLDAEDFVVDGFFDAADLVIF